MSESSDRKYIYLVEPSRDPALFGWQAALAGRESKRANVVLVGPSTVEGYPTTDFTRTPAQELAKALRAKFPTSGLGIAGGRGRLGIPSQGLSPALPTPLSFVGGLFDPVSYGATPTLHFGANHTCWYTHTAGHKLTFTLKRHETSFDLRHILGTSGHTTAGYYKINDGPAVPFSTAAGSNALATLHVNVATESFSDWSFDGGSPMSGATVEIGCSGTGYLIVSEIVTYASDESSGLMVHGVGHAGYSSVNWAVGSTLPGGWRSAIAALEPDVIILESGLNDAVANSAGAFATGLAAFVAAIRSVGGPIPTVPILIAAPYDATGGEMFVDPWPNYVAEMRAIANTDPLIAFVNEGDRMPPTALMASFGLYHSDKIHGNANGKAYATQAQILAEALSFGY